MGISILQSLKIKSITSADSMVGAHYFNSTNYLAKKEFPIKGWQLIRDAPVAQIFFYVHNELAISGYQSTFGSFDLASDITTDELRWFVDKLIGEFKKLHVKKVEIKLSPHYGLHSEQIEDVLVHLGFDETIKEVNQHINISKFGFSSIAKRNELKKIKQCYAKEFDFGEVGISQLPEIYELVTDTRLRKGYTVSMSYQQVHEAILANTSNYLLFVIKEENKIIAASVSVIINSNTLYNFYHADDIAYRSFSPISFLVHHIYKYCQQHDFTVLDLGISSKNGTLNEGLFNFKKNLGATKSNKKTYSISL